MIDFTSLFLVVGLFLGLVVGDAAYFGDPISVQITVSPRLSATGFNQSAGEELFAAEAAEIGLATSIVPTPNVELSTRPALAAAIAAPLKLEGIVLALQNRIGIPITTIHGAFIDGAKAPALSMLMVISVPGETPAKLSLARDDGDVRMLLHEATRQALEMVAPYRVALTEFVDGLDGDQASMAGARTSASRAVMRLGKAGRATERVMLYNLLGLVALASGDAAGPEPQFQLADTIPGALPGAYGTVSINRAFLAVAAKRPADARRWFEKSRRQTEDVKLPGWTTEMDMLGALVAWSEGNLARAETLLRAAIAATPSHQGPHVYLAKLLAARGDASGAAAEQDSAPAKQRLNTRIPSLAQSEFWVDPVNGGITPRK